MTSSPLFTDAQRYLRSGSPAGLTVTWFETVDDVAELTVAFVPQALERVLRAQLETVGDPTDWDCAHASTNPGSPTWTYALELSRVFNEHCFSHLLLERHEPGLGGGPRRPRPRGHPVVAAPGLHSLHPGPGAAPPQSRAPEPLSRPPVSTRRLTGPAPPYPTGHSAQLSSE